MGSPALRAVRTSVKPTLLLGVRYAWNFTYSVLRIPALGARGSDHILVGT